MDAYVDVDDMAALVIDDMAISGHLNDAWPACPQQKE